MSNLSLDQETLLWDMNNEKATLFIPAMVFVGILMLAGIMGNCMVLYFYGYKSKTSPSTSFILALAVLDLVSCIVGMPMEIADLRYFFSFESVAACKILRFVTYFASVSSGLTLVVIAVDRFRRICKPFERQMKDGHVKVICTVVGVISLLLSWPAILFNDVVDVDLANSYNIELKGHDCTTTKEEGLRQYMFAFNVIYAIAFLIITVTLAVLYTFIGAQLFRHKKFRFYVAKKATTTRRINVAAVSDASSEESLLGPRQPTSAVFEDPPDASGSIVDLREFVTRGMPEVEHDRPTSGYTAVTATTGVTGFTDLSGKTKRTLQSIKSVTICDPSQNQVFPIEARDDMTRPGSGKSDSTWSTYKQRPGSGSSLATFSSRPSSAALSAFSDVLKPRMRQKITFHSDPTNENMSDAEDELETAVEEVNVVKENKNGQIASEENDLEVNEIGQIQHEDVNTNNETKQEHDNISDIEIEQANIVDDDERNKNTETKQIFRTTIENQQAITENDSKQQGNVDLINTQLEPYRKYGSSDRPISGSSESSKRSKTSSTTRSSRTTVTSPASNITMASSVASRASTVKRFKRLLGGKAEKLNTDTNNVKEIRMKMLDMNTIKYTMVMLVITVVFVISFLPYLSLVVWRYYNDEYEVNIMSDAELLMFQIGIRSFFINSAVNPFIYGGFNSKFRAFFYSMFCTCCIKKKTRKRGSRPARDQSDSTSGT